MAEPFFVIDAREYPIPERSTFSLDECRVFHDWSGVYVEDLDDLPVNSLMIAAFMQIAYMRGNPGVSARVARDLIGASNLAEALERFDLAVGDASPPEPQKNEPRTSESPERPSESTTSSGDDSTNDSDAQVIGLTPGGPRRSETSAAFRSLTSGS